MIRDKQQLEAFFQKSKEQQEAKKEKMKKKKVRIVKLAKDDLKRLYKRFIKLQNKPNKTREQLEEFKYIEKVLKKV